MPKISRLKRRILSHYLLVRFLLVSAILIAVLIFLLPVIRLTKDLVIPQEPQLKNSSGRTNVLILGIGGQAHDGPDLSDTMIVVSIPVASPSAITLISIPRDIYLDSLQGKINSAYSLSGLTAAKAAANTVTGLPIHYGLRVDFSAFQQIIDTLGGVDINVAQTLDDPFYPITGKEDDNCGLDPQMPEEAFPCRYEHLLIPAGPTHMNGGLALKFVRSRHATGEEGTDFARSRRQELLISALKSKVFSTDTFLNPGKIAQIYNLLKSHIDTDISPADTSDFLKLALKYHSVSFKSIVLDQSFFDNPPIDSRGWILLPKDGTFAQIHQFIKSQL